MIYYYGYFPSRTCRARNGEPNTLRLFEKMIRSHVAVGERDGSGAALVTDQLNLLNPSGVGATSRQWRTSNA